MCFVFRFIICLKMKTSETNNECDLAEVQYVVLSHPVFPILVSIFSMLYSDKMAPVV